MNEFQLPADNAKVQPGYYWCRGWHGQHYPRIVRIGIQRGRMVMDDGNPHTHITLGLHDERPMTLAGPLQPPSPWVEPFSAAKRTGEAP